MRPILHWGGVALPVYPVMLYFGLVAGVASGNLAAHALGVDALAVFAVTMLLIPPSLAGARLLYVAMHWRRHYKNHPERIWDRRQGGMAMYGGLPVMLVLSVVLTRAFGIGIEAFWDAAIFTILTGMVFGKTGCYLNGCCGGRGIWRERYPVQLLEAGWAALLTVFAAALATGSSGGGGSMPYPGALFLLTAAMYAVGRLVFETLRVSDRPDGGRLRVGAVFSVAILLLALAVHLVMRRA